MCYVNTFSDPDDYVKERASPKSATLTVHDVSSRMFDGLRSRWTTSAEWMYFNALAILKLLTALLIDDVSLMYLLEKVSPYGYVHISLHKLKN